MQLNHEKSDRSGIVTRLQVVRFALCSEVSISVRIIRIVKLIFYVVKPGIPRQLGDFSWFFYLLFFPRSSWIAALGQEDIRDLVDKRLPWFLSGVLRLWAGWLATPWGKLWPDDASTGLWVLSLQWLIPVLPIVRSQGPLWARSPVAQNEPPWLKEPHRLITVNLGFWSFINV